MIGRRALLASAGAVLVLPRAAVARAGAVGELRFAMMRGGSDRLGTHRLEFSRDGEQLTVDISVEVLVTILGVRVYRYSHASREVWERGRLRSLDGRTDDNGKVMTVQVRAVPEGLRIDGTGGSRDAPADAVPTSYWNPETLHRSALIDIEDGVMRAITVTPRGMDTVQAAGRSVPARHYRIGGDIDQDIWYNETGTWVHSVFHSRGTDVTYVAEAAEPPV